MSALPFAEWMAVTQDRAESALGRFLPVEHRHVGVQNEDVGQMLRREFADLLAISHHVQDLQVGPQLGQLAAQRLGQHRRVFGNQGGRGAHVNSSGWAPRGGEGAGAR